MAPDAKPPFLVIRLSSLGDVARLLPGLRAMKAAGAGRVDITVEDRFAPLLEYFPVGDRVVPYPRKGLSPLRHPKAWSSAMKAYFGLLRAGGYGTAIDLHGLLRSALVARFSGAASTAGYARGFGREGSHLLYGRRLVPAPQRRISRYDRYAGALQALGFPAPSGEFFAPSVSQEARKDVESFLAERDLSDGGYLFAFLGTSRAQAHKRWPLRRFLELAAAAHGKLNLPMVLGWGPDEADLVATLPAEALVYPVPLWDLGRLLEAIRRARAFVGADTGAMHLSALMGVPTVAVMGPTDPVLNRPFGTRSEVVHREGIQRACRGDACPHTDCMGAISSEEVFAALRRLLQES